MRRWPEKGFIHKRVLLFQLQRDWRTEERRIIATEGTGKHKPTQKWRPLEVFSAARSQPFRKLPGTTSRLSQPYHRRNKASHEEGEIVSARRPIFSTPSSNRRVEHNSRIKRGTCHERCTIDVKNHWSLHFRNHSTKAANENQFSIDVYFSRNLMLRVLRTCVCACVHGSNYCK